jgi:hypothetical protein
MNPKEGTLRTAIQVASVEGVTESFDQIDVDQMIASKRQRAIRDCQYYDSGLMD